ncbi:MAG: TetR/AcrR family transcriptional regulator [Treponema sp.]|nr:TetR/AcrR family transcriptional regulator [Treponema sp.]
MANYKVGLETRERILQVTRDLFYEKGYIRTTYADICNAIGISQGTFTTILRAKANWRKSSIGIILLSNAMYSENGLT